MDRIGFRGGKTPRLLYATRQIVTNSTVTRAMHRHEDCTELLYVYQGAGQAVTGMSPMHYMIRCRQNIHRLQRHANCRNRRLY